MITAGEPQEFIPLGREHLFVHPRDVYLFTDNVPAAPATHGSNLTRDLLKALRGVSLKDEIKEQWFIKQSENDEWEEEFYWKGNTVVWSKNSGYGKNRIRRIHKSFTMENHVLQVLWSEFRIRSCKPRIADSVIEMEDTKQDVLSGVCIIENSSLSIFAQNGEDFILTTPFQVLRAWPCNYGIIFERNIALDESLTNLKINQPDNLPVMFSMMHPLDDIAPIVHKRKESVLDVSYFCDPSEEIVFCCSKPSLVFTYNKKGFHSIWRLRTTTFQEAEYACKIQIKSNLFTNNIGTPVTKSSNHSSKSKLNFSNRTPSTNVNSPYSSFPSSRVASPAGMQGRSFSPSVSSLTHMATLSRSQPPSHNTTSSHPQSYTPMSTLSCRSPTSPQHSNDASKFMEPLAPDICFEQEWIELTKNYEKAKKAFLSTDIIGYNYICFLLSKQNLLQLVKFQENDSDQWIFGNISSIPAVDAEPLLDLNLIIIVDTNFTLSLYSGLTKVSKVHIADMFGLVGDNSYISSLPPHLFLNTPKRTRTSLIASTRPPSAVGTRFGDEIEIISPVPMVIEESKNPNITDESSFFQVGLIKHVRDGIRNKVTLETSSGYFRIQVPKASTSITVLKCLNALKYVLKHDVYSIIFVKWYCVKNSPGPTDMNTNLELNAFLVCLLNNLGFDADNVILGNCKRDSSIGPAQMKKQKTHEKGCDDDWTYLVSENLHKQSVEFCTLKENAYFSSAPFEKRYFDKNGLLFPYMSEILLAMHLVYEDCKLDIACWEDLSPICSFLCELARELRQHKYLDHYWMDFPEQFFSVSKNILLPIEELQKLAFPANFSATPCIYHQIKSFLSSGRPNMLFPYIPNVTRRLHAINLVFAVLTSMDSPLETSSSCLISINSPNPSTKELFDDNSLKSCYGIDWWASSHPKKAVALLLTKLGFTEKDLNTLPVGIALPIRDSLIKCWHEPSGLWSKEVYDLIGRRDLSFLQMPEKNEMHIPLVKPKQENAFSNLQNNSNKDNDDVLNYIDLEVLKLRFGKDHRIYDVYNMLQSSKPVSINLVQRPEVSDHEFIEEQERHLYNLCIRTMAATVGRGMLTLRAYNPVVTETLPIPKLCLTGRAPPRNTTVDLSHIDVPSNMNMWPLFHNGVAAGLSISLNASKIDSTWMVYNKPRSSSNDTPTEHAGFLMALGLNGHLSRLTSLSIHDYLCKGHELTSVGILLGVSVAKRGTMDLSATKMLSIHIEALLPPTSTELDVSPTVQVAAVMGLGLLYQGSGHHHMAEVLLGEIGRPPGPEMEHCVDRESYALTAGLALGLITFGKGKSMSGVADFPMADQLYYYMVGGHKRPLTGIHKEKHKSPSYQIREGDNVNVDVTSPGATLALGMMFFDTDNQAIADWMTAPDTQFLLDMVRPDFLLLRTLSKGLILWSSVHPSVQWVESHLPAIVLKHAFQKGKTHTDIDYETMSQVYCNIIAGGCFCLGLKFAGSANNEAFKTLMQFAKQFVQLSRKYASDQAGRSTVETCLNVIVLSLSMVMAGTGDLDVIRICRHLRSRVHQAASYVLYGSHVVTHMGLGLLFLGGGRYTLNTAPLSIGAMICAFFPKFPQHSNDSRYHLQALYHLYVLAVEPRLIVPRLIDSKKPVYINVTVKFKDSEFYQDAAFTYKAPCILPELKFLEKVIIEDNRYWPIIFDCNENWDVLCSLLENGGALHVMQKAGCLPHKEDPKGFQSLLARSSLWTNVHAWIRKDLQVSNFSSDPVALNFATCFLNTTAQKEQERQWQQRICSILFECASLEKMEALPITIALLQMTKLAHFSHHTFEMWQIKLVAAFDKWSKIYSNKFNDDLTLLRPDMSIILMSEMEKTMQSIIKSYREPLIQYLSNNFKPINDVIPFYPPELVSYILFHDIHTASPFNFPYQGELPLPIMLAKLHNSSVTVSSIMSLSRILK